MKKTISIPIEIDSKTTIDFVMHELTTVQIMELAQINPIFGGKKGVKEGEVKVSKKEVSPMIEGFFGELSSFLGSGEKVMEMSCQFKMDDLIPLAPSDLEKIFAGFQEVNQTFLTILEKLGILGLFKELMIEIISDFSATSAT